jgi:L-fuconolactonase
MTTDLNRRTFLQATAGAALVAATAPSVSALDEIKPRDLIIDTHQHLWDLDKFRLPWLQNAPEILRRSYTNKDYLEATQGLNIKAVYMEVDVDPEQHVEEVEHVTQLSKSGKVPTMSAIVGGRPAGEEFAAYVKLLKDNPYVRGVRQVLHGESTPAGFCLQPSFVRGVQMLGEIERTFDLCMRPGELQDALRLTKRCPDTRFVLDHCGNADPKAFRKNSDATHDPEQWKRDIADLAKQGNLSCKISGIVARAPESWTAEDLAPIVNHCLDEFGPDRVVFGGDWPVCLLGAPLRDWIDALKSIVASRPAEEQRKLWHANAVRVYGLAAAPQ